MAPVTAFRVTGTDGAARAGILTAVSGTRCQSKRAGASVFGGARRWRP